MITKLIFFFRINWATIEMMSSAIEESPAFDAADATDSSLTPLGICL